jgi:TatD DNase family protein
MTHSKHPIPQLGFPITETHCHLDFLAPEAVAATLELARAQGVHRFVTIGTAPDNLDRVKEIAGAHNDVWCTLGIHPHDAKSADVDVMTRIRTDSISANRVVAVGEIGLDYHYGYSEKKVQQTVFETQLQIAADLDLPVVIHSREADDDTQAILANFASTRAIKGVIHSFTSGIGLAEYCLSENFMLGFNGIITFNRAENVRDVLKITPLDRMVVETDTPYLTPVPYRGKENAPCYLPFIVQRMASEKALAVDEMLAHLEANANRLFPGLI